MAILGILTFAGYAPPIFDEGRASLIGGGSWGDVPGRDNILGNRVVAVIYVLNSSSFFLNWDSLHARLNSHYEAWSYKKKRDKKY